MLAYTVEGDISQITQHLSGLAQEQVPFATILALTRTAKFVQAKIKEEIPRAFDRPTPFTINSTYVQPATKQRRYAMVYIKEAEKGRVAPIRFLQPEIYGGPRGRKSFEKRLIDAGRMPPGTYVVPARGAKLDQYGNFPGSELVRVLSDLRAHFDTTQNRGRKRRRGKPPQSYFSTWPPSPKTQHLKPGIYLRTTFRGLGGTAIKPVLMFVRSVSYRKRLRYFEIADQTARMRFPYEFAIAMRHALATARR